MRHPALQSTSVSACGCTPSAPYNERRMSLHLEGAPGVPHAPLPKRSAAASSILSDTLTTIIKPRFEPIGTYASQVIDFPTTSRGEES